MKAKRARGPELRTRTGCNKCRQRRVKCPEQKPVCGPCQTLGFVCSYDKTLKWQGVESPAVAHHDQSHMRLSPLQQIEKWMFLHVSQQDFGPTPPLHLLSDPDSEDSSSDVDSEASLTRQGPAFLSTSDMVCLTNDDHGSVDLTLASWLPPLSMSPVESHLWTYFHEAIAPACVLNPQLNPYQDVILRIAASTGSTSPLFHSIMAISASQLYILGNRRFHSHSCDYRYQALRRLRLETAKMEGDFLDQASRAQILATVMALVFLDILSDCSASWVVHANFARSLIREFRDNHGSSDQDIETLFNFVGGYIVVHEVYAHTAWNATVSDPSEGSVTTMCDDSNLQTLTGCSTEFFQILANINSLASDYSRYYKLSCPDPNVLSNLQQRRDGLERQLHACAPSTDVENRESCVPESVLVLETKRLTGLLHLYSRVDHLGPYDGSIPSLAGRILALVARIPARSNTILWPLFMVATLGIGPECDADRAFILEKVDTLLRKRQMRYIKKARRIITEVWKIRDLREPEMRLGWDILQQVAQLERISLF